MKLYKIFKNPFSVWISRLTSILILEQKYHTRHLKIGYMSNAKKCIFGNYVTINSNVKLFEATFGDFTFIADNTNITRTTIGKFCSIGPNCNIGLGKHPSNTFVSTHPIFYSKLQQSQITFADKNYYSEFEEININNDVWIGANVIILDGVRLSNGVIIAAGSVVTKSIPPYAIAAGIPAKVIKYGYSKIA